MKATVVILGFFAGLLLSIPPLPVSAQTGYPTQVAKLASLRSGNPQNVVNAITTISQDDLAKTLYQNLYHVAGSEPSSLLEASAVAKALGFVLLVGLDSDLQTLSESSLEQKRIALQSLLLQIRTEVGCTVDEYQWHAVQLMQFCTAYDFYRAYTGTEDGVIEALLASYASSATTQLEQTFVIKNNLSLKLAASAGYAALILQGSSAVTGAQREHWLAVSMAHIEKTLWEYQSDPDGMYGYSEGPWYFRYAMMNLLPFFVTFDETSGGGSIRAEGQDYASPLRQSRYKRLFDWIATIRMPSGMLPPFEDSYMNTFFPELATLGGIPDYSNLAWENFTAAAEPANPARLSSELARSFDGRVEYLLRMSTLPSGSSDQPLVRHMPNAGYSVFRSSWDETALYFALIGKHGIARTHRSPVGSGHKQANESACMLAAGGEMLLLEPGYHSSGEREALVYSDHHNIMLVDGSGPDSTSYGSNLFGVDAWIGDTLTQGSSGMAAVTTRYQDADIERRSTVLGGRFVILRDAARSAFPRTYTQQLHGNGLVEDGTCTLHSGKQYASWTRGAMTLHAVSASPSGTLTQALVRRRHAPSSGRFAEHDALYSSLRAADAVFHTVLYPARDGEQVSTNIPVTAPGTTLIDFRTGDDQLLSLININTCAVTVDAPVFGALTTDALAFHCILDPAGRPESWMCDEGRSVLRDDVELLSSSMPVRVVWSHDECLRISIRSDAAGTLRIAVPQTVTRLTGDGIGSWSMVDGMLLLEITGGNADITAYFDGAATGVPDTHASPRALQLGSPYPQPLRADAGHINVPCTLATADHVTLSVNDMLGREVVRRRMGNHSAGNHVLSLPLQQLQPGVYFLKLSTAHTAVMRRFVIR
ncbi:T9SS type A sorting domain-containing protein [bacterium]|nr:T9SS type A sorting domain-containing protein [bacterium]